ncbi:hypothetical protein BDV26DRAFT_289258 [Aspergillus bertholletiae]|uniref:PD-(D/E)XK nuclease-like domain-containing protein n=1 Tax=Aspergillus bertholletiae TaxID=1226010 RepID=A0A5N7BIR3_9EURO|nr:hypothetical protein BDV26DRAFT_289258 [Aspergillus bertholletiae]
MWNELEEIRLDARHCDIYGKDENAWCLDVVQPILRTPTNDTPKLQLTSVYAIATNRYGSFTHDYALSFSCRDPEVSNLYERVSLGGHGYSISQTTDAFNKRTILFSGVEVKPDDGGKKEALAQLAIWLSANLEKMRRLGELVKRPLDVTDWLLATIGYTVVGHDWHVYIAYRIGDEVHVVGPISAVLADTRSTYGILKLRDLDSRRCSLSPQTKAKTCSSVHEDRQMTKRYVIWKPHLTTQ